MITVKDIAEDQYPLSLDDLETGQFAECDNGTTVIKALGDAVNLANGVAGYHGNGCKFRRLYSKVIEIVTDQYAHAIE